MNSGQGRTLKDVLLDPDGPHDIPLPRRGWLGTTRRIAAFLDDTAEELVASLPDWNFEMFEVSNSVLRVTATDSLGHRVEITGTDPNDLHKRAVEAAKSIEDQCKN